jgi:4-amino-4-deoxy-L-arabinose transferase-like glycosyltransferase
VPSAFCLLPSVDLLPTFSERLYLHLSAPAKRAWLLLFIGIGAFYIWGLGSLPLVGPDEPRYAEVAREMLARRDFITPTLGGLPWFEKPPLLYWMMMVGYRVLGVNEYAARLGPAGCGLLTALFVYWLGSSIGKTGGPKNGDESDSAVGRWSALVWLSSLGAIGFSRGATFDILLTMTVTGALTCFFINEVSTRSGSDGAQRHTLLLVAFYFLAGLSLLAKGLIGFVIIFGVITLYLVIRREWPTRGFTTSLIWGLPLALALAGLWYGPMIARHGSTFVYQFVVQHHFARFVTNKYHHPGPFYFYVPVLIGLAVPWTIVLVASLTSTRRWNWRGQSGLDRLRVLALIWLIVPLVFFSFSGSKLAAYILPGLPGVALLAGERIACWCREERGQRVLQLTGILLTVVVLSAIWYTHGHSDLSFAVPGLSAVPIVATGVLAILRPRLRGKLFLAISIATVLTAAIAIRLVAPTVARSQSVRDLLAAANARGYSNIPIVQLHTIERSAEFYASGRISYGPDGEPVKFEGAGQVIDAARRNHGMVLCFVPANLVSQLSTLPQLNVEMIGDNGRAALVLAQAR